MAKVRNHRKEFEHWFNTLESGDEGVFKFLLYKAFEEGCRVSRGDILDELLAYKMELIKVNKEVDELSKRLYSYHSIQ